jgi:hypothetical protein
MAGGRIRTSLLLAVGISGIAGWVSAQESGYCPVPASARVATIGGKTITATELDTMARGGAGARDKGRGALITVSGPR